MDDVNARFPGVDIKKSMLKEAVYSVSFYDSIVSFSIDQKNVLSAVGLQIMESS